MAATPGTLLDVADPSSRMLTLLSLLQSPRDWPGRELTDRLDVSPRTLRRDVDRLRELGYRIATIKGPYGGYRLEAGSELPPLLFDDEQAVAVAVALQSAPASGVDIDDAAARALATVRQVMPSRLRHRLDRLRFDGPAATVRVDPAVLEAATEAVRERRTLRFAYGVGEDGADDDAPLRHAEPHAVVARHGRWYLVAWDLARDDWRTFRLDRLQPRSTSGTRFKPRELPAGDAASFLAARAKGSETTDAWPCVGQVVIDQSAADLAPWIPDGTIEPQSLGGCLVTLGSWSWPALVARILQFDAPFELLGPPELLEAASEQAQRLSSGSITGSSS